MTEAETILCDLIDWWESDDPDEGLLSLRLIVDRAKAVLQNGDGPRGEPDTALSSDDIDDTRAEISRISELARTAFGDRFHFTTVTIWGPQHRQRHAAVGVTLHIHNASKSFAGATPLDALADAERFIREHDPAAAEAAGWQILGVVRA